MVQLALRRPYTFIVMAMLIVLATPFVLARMATDIFPEINIPVVSVIWNYTGLPAQEMGQRISGQVERGLTTTVSDIEHIESQSLAGVSIIKVFFQPTANIEMAISQVVASMQAQVRQLPPGITPPLVIKYSASSVPVIQLALSSPTRSENSLFDATVNQLRPQLITVPGAAIPFPYGGKNRLISVDLDTQALQARGLSPADVVNAVNTQNLILPSGTAKFGATEYNVKMNGSPDAIAGLNDLPIRTVNGATTYLRDVAYVRDGFSPQTNVVRQDGVRGVLLSVLKNGGASTLDIVSNIRAMLPIAAQTMPEDIKITPLFDQSVFVKAAVKGVVFEAILAAALTAAMVLLFLGNWRSTLIIGLTIPLSILASILVLYSLGETLNLMTLGGLALSVGILVDQAIVTIENIERHLHMGTPLKDAIEVGAGEIGSAAFVSTLCICIVFVPMFFLSGVARFLFVPLAEAVVFAMIASYLLSRTLVPTLVMLLMGGSHGPQQQQPAEGTRQSALQRLYRAFDRRFERVRRAYTLVLSAVLSRRAGFIGLFLGFCLLSCLLYPVLGRDFFPTVDAGQIRLHLRAPTGTRIEETARLTDQVEAAIRELVPPDQLETILDNLGVPNSGINLSYSNAGTIGTFDGELLLSLKEGHKPTEQHVSLLRAELPKRFPGIEFFFQPADIVTQILNFGLPAAIDVQFSGNDMAGNAARAAELTKAIRQIPGAVDAHVHQRLDGPALSLQMDRTRLQQYGLTASNVGQNVLIALSGSSQTAPAFWLNPANGVVYSIAVQTPQYTVDSLDSLLNIPVGASGGQGGTGAQQLLGNLVSTQADRQPAVMSRYNIAPVIDVYVSVQGTDLASVASKVQKLVDEMRPKLSRGSRVDIRGQVQTMQSSFIGLGVGLAMAIVLVYLLIVVTFQSWLDAAIIITALPAALAGIAWMLFITGTTLSVPALTGAIMTMGVATANSILLVSFARERLQAGIPPLSAALEAGATRIRPVLMTALAMIIGMIPMALGLGEGAEQNAPLGRAVIGGLVFATVSTLFFVPAVFAGVHSRLARRRAAREASQQHQPPEGATPQEN
ncbi:MULTISPECIES: efflux RND transporter permease subunit [Variovorax]|jgi:CzcA family heavy metal efflux pump|uniref:efflux RND transporter permease subunit n=1 Tax=Variovorax TaxID=34072 RepID=UPI0008695EE2|nr:MULTISPECIES: efflux RND transporter permease subunit [Variovorax]MBN8753590.1 efflux RND transporter permease subunit [Variovorax sp.]ODU12928.1 MAG: RND transporter [Variovorax sp. SCN 67-85]ODV27460.1 MAG: RND transporter [Variovorax sp. SCN 67-20]OJZ12152.1 MAG: RND transporter [Variovorax sp. 67-131]UKI06014.1 efflux RND transporter permease subunit [Variovorax paradoxus]